MIDKKKLAHARMLRKKFNLTGIIKIDFDYALKLMAAGSVVTRLSCELTWDEDNKSYMDWEKMVLEVHDIVGLGFSLYLTSIEVVDNNEIPFLRFHVELWNFRRTKRIQNGFIDKK